MLLITRREGEAIVINGSIEVKVIEIRGGRVKLGFEYPTGNSVFRQELFVKIQAENQAAALPSNMADSARLSNLVQTLQGKPHQKQIKEGTASDTISNPSVKPGS